MWKKIKYEFIINVMFFIYSFTGVLTKYAAQEKFMGYRFMMFYGGVLMLMGVYAIAWQQVLRRLPLMAAYANKAVVMIWGLLWGVLFFGEGISIGKLTGVILAAFGVVLFAHSSFEGDNEDK